MKKPRWNRRNKSDSDWTQKNVNSVKTNQFHLNIAIVHVQTNIQTDSQYNEMARFSWIGANRSEIAS